MRYLMSSVHFCTISTGIVCTISLLPRSVTTCPFFAGINHVKPTVLMQLLYSCWFRGVLLLAIKPAGVQKLSKRSTSCPDFRKHNVPKQWVMTWIVLLLFFFRVKLILSLEVYLWTLTIQKSIKSETKRNVLLSQIRGQKQNKHFIHHLGPVKAAHQTLGLRIAQQTFFFMETNSYNGLITAGLSHCPACS